MLKVVLLQIIATLVAALLSSYWLGVRGILSAVFGGMACVLPNFLFALRLQLPSSRTASSFAINFFIGEIFKIFATISFLLFVTKIYSELHWPSFLLGLVLASQAVFFAFWNAKS